ncbi:MAG: bifunctional DNA-formamidopyrimidine glycosylase/DNA-(apurinic or apyrimidinic site) lyase [Patescibacteria group bacterium]
MPELPEVETIRRQLEKHLAGHKILGVDITVAKIFPQGKERVVGGKIKSVRRLGKVLIVDLTNGYSFLVHLKLTGQIIYASPKFPNEPNKFTHVVFTLDRGAKLFFNDSRKFGWIKVEKTADVAKESFVKKLGPEPLRDLTAKGLGAIVSASRRPIKILLMDQTKVSGVGNIYANDALWLAKISPRRPANSLTADETKALFRAILKVLADGIKYQGASDQWYVTAEGKKGSYQEHFLAYGREGEPCERCHKAKFVKISLGGRGTYICPVCQRL